MSARPEGDGDACECVVRGHHGPDDTECLAEFGLSDGGRLLCSRPEGHDGPHAACNRRKHPILAWVQEDDSE